MVKFGVTLPMAEDDTSTRMPSYADIRAVARAAEDAGLDSVWGYDHLLFRDDDGQTPAAERSGQIPSIRRGARRGP